MILVDLIVMLALAVASGCGIGGGGLLVVYLSLVKGVPQSAAQAVNLLFYILAAVSSTVWGGLGKNTALLKRASICSAIALPGAYLGSLVRGNISDTALRAVFGLFLIAAGVTAGVPSLKKLQAKRRKKAAK